MSDSNNQQPTGLSLGPSETPFEAAATLFGMYAPKFEQQLKELSTGELRRLLNALVQYPLNEKEFVDDSQRLRTAFALGQALLEAKWVMVMQSVMEHEQKLREAEETATETETEKEQANG
jgi:hypothetical protein